ncbi:MAG: alpha/beta hydrolase-fold protein [Bacteroidales bacterium]
MKKRYNILTVMLLWLLVASLGTAIAAAMTPASAVVSAAHSTSARTNTSASARTNVPNCACVDAPMSARTGSSASACTRVPNCARVDAPISAQTGSPASAQTGSPASAQTKSAYVQDSIYSAILGETRHFAVYLPAGFGTDPDKEYPVLYLLHGGAGTWSDWNNMGHVKAIADQMMASGESRDMVIVMPDAGTTMMTYFNGPGWNYEDHFFEELMPVVEARYKIKSRKEARAVAGLSMGGQSSVMYACHRPDVFAVVYAMSAYLYPSPISMYNTDDPVHKEIRKRVADNNAVRYIENLAPEQAEALKDIVWLIDCGDDDFTYRSNVEFSLAMKEKNIPLQVRIYDGAHSWYYWRAALRRALPFISANVQ